MLFLFFYTAEATPQPFRIKFNTSLIDDRDADGKPIDKHLCTQDSEFKKFKFLDNDVSCEDNIPDPEDIKKFKECLQNVALFFKSFIQVEPITYPITARFTESQGDDNQDDFQYNLTTTDADYHVIVTYRPPVNEVSCALSCCTVTDPDQQNRPIGGYLIVLTSAISNLQDIDITNKSESNSIFWTICHEVLHLMGFQPNLLQYWHKDGVIHSRIIEYVKNPIKRDDTMAMLVTPNVYRVTNGKGAQLEDAGAYSENCHFKTRIYMRDVLSSISFPGQFISTLTIACIQDMGWYIVDTSKIKVTPFIVHDSQESMPHVYSKNKCRYYGESKCFNHLYFGSCSHVDICSSQDDCFQTYVDQYNVDWDDNTTFVLSADPRLDYAPLIIPYEKCSTGSQCFNTDIGAQCIAISCNDDGDMVINYNGKTAICKNEGDMVNIGGVNIECSLNECKPTNEQLPTSAIVAITVGSVFALAGATIPISYFTAKRSKINAAENHDEKPENDKTVEDQDPEKSVLKS